MSRRELCTSAVATSGALAASATALTAFAVPALGAPSSTEVSRLGSKYEVERQRTRDAFAPSADYPAEDFHFTEDDVAEELIATSSVNLNDLKVKAKVLFNQLGYKDELWGRPEQWTYTDLPDGLVLSLIEDILAL